MSRFLIYLLVFSWVPLTAVVASESETMPKTAGDFLVQGLDDVEPAFATFPGKMYAGLLSVDIPKEDTNRNKNKKNGAEFMFWLFVPDIQSVPDTMVLWLNGGPGCSSIFGGVLVENSPVTAGQHAPGTCCLGPLDPLRPNPDYAWTVATTMLYVEQPTGVGFSRGGTPPINEDEVAKDFYGFLQNFYAVFPNLQPYRLSLFGESYAGMFCPAIAHRIATENDRVKKHDTNPPSSSNSSSKTKRIIINLDGLGLGNAWMDATVQGPAVIDYAWWHGMIDAYTRDVFHDEWEHCYGSGSSESFVQEEEPAPFHSFTTPDECGIMEAVLMAAGAGVLPEGLAPNTYDVTTFDPYAVIGNKNTTIYKFMNNLLVKEALHAPSDVEWQGCIPGAGRRRKRRRRLLGMLQHDKPISVVPYLADLLDKWNVRVLVYNGDLDMSTNAQGSEMLLNEMQWSGHTAWKVSGRGVWMLRNEIVAGYIKKFSNLSFLVVKNSGHLVPMNRPAQALDLVERFLRNSPFLDIPLPSFLLTPPPPSSDPKSMQPQQQQQDGHNCKQASRDASSWRSGWLWVIVQCLGAIVCFLAGAIASHSWRRQGYQPITNADSPHANGSYPRLQN